jgi:hypothetical protein
VPGRGNPSLAQTGWRPASFRSCSKRRRLTTVWKKKLDVDEWDGAKRKEEFIFIFRTHMWPKTDPAHEPSLL